jgi:lipopolysaccharide export system permease protein
MKKLDKLVLNAFIAPFFLTFIVVVFILLNIQMLRYFDDLIGKGLEWIDIAKLLFYFAIFTAPTAFPLAILLSSLIAFGNLGEHFELTAIKSAGISLVRALLPIFVFVLMLTVVAFYTNNNLVPKAALEAYSLLYDIKQKKPALDLREGTFYNGITDISIKVDKKYPEDDAALGGIVVYDHRKGDGNKEVTKADSGRMYTIHDERYLKFELFNGYNYSEGANDENVMAGRKNRGNNETFTRSKFEKTQVVFDLSSFQMERTDKKWFQGNRIMRNLRQLDDDIDSIKRDVLQQRLNYYMSRSGFFTLFNRNKEQVLPDELVKFRVWRDSVQKAKLLPDSTSAIIKVDKTNKIPADVTVEKPAKRSQTNKKPEKRPLADKGRNRTFKNIPGVKNRHLKNAMAPKEAPLPQKDTISKEALAAKIDSLFNMTPEVSVVQASTNAARSAKSQIENSNTGIDTYVKELRVFEIQWHKILANSLACVAMFLIGAPLGAIIKKGGLGVPFLVSILFFIIYYILSMQGEKLAKQNIVSAFSGIWAADLILLIVGLVFLRQARVDARLFEADFYAVAYARLKQWTAGRKVTGKIASN